MFKNILSIFSFFDKKLKLKLIYVQCIMLISSVFEILAIFSIGPLIQVLSNPDIVNNQDKFISKIYDYLNFASFDNFLIFMVISIFCFLFMSTIILSFTIYLLSMFGQHLGNILRSSLFKFYILQDWLYHSKSNSSENIESVAYETNRITQNIIMPILITNSKFFSGILIIISLMIYNPIVSTVCFLIFGSLYGTIFVFVRARVAKHGENQGHFMSEMYRILNESFTGIKEAIIYSNQKKYYEHFFKSGSEYANSTGKIQFFANAPRYILEFFAISIILFFILFLVYSGNGNFNETLPILSIYIFAGYKLLPIFQAIYIGAVLVKSNIPAYSKIEKELLKSKNYFFKIEKNKYEKLKLNEQESMVFNNVSFSYTDLSLKVVKDIKLEIKPNTLNFIVGASGSGKSTMIDLILGLISPQEGDIYLGKNKLDKDNSKFWQQNIGYVGQNIFLIDDTIKNNICFADLDEEFNEERFKLATHYSYVDDFLKDFPDGIDTLVGERGLMLSGGQRQRIAIARALYQDKNFLILDEATASLDGIAEKFIIDQLKDLSKIKTIVMVTHNVKLCVDGDMIYLLDKGQIKNFGNYDKIKTDNLFLKLLNEK